jgi:hypothetical protein
MASTFHPILDSRIWMISDDQKKVDGPTRTDDQKKVDGPTRPDDQKKVDGPTRPDDQKKVDGPTRPDDQKKADRPRIYRNFDPTSQIYDRVPCTSPL